MSKEGKSILWGRKLWTFNLKEENPVVGRKTLDGLRQKWEVTGYFKVTDEDTAHRNDGEFRLTKPT